VLYRLASVVLVKNGSGEPEEALPDASCHAWQFACREVRGRSGP